MSIEWSNPLEQLCGVFIDDQKYSSQFSGYGHCNADSAPLPPETVNAGNRIYGKRPCQGLDSRSSTLDPGCSN